MEAKNSFWDSFGSQTIAERLLCPADGHVFIGVFGQEGRRLGYAAGA
jgi:hypothetical protein